MELNKEVLSEALQNEETRGLIAQVLNEHEAGQQLLNSHAENYFESKVKSKIGEIHSGYDKDFEEVTGIKKPDGVKSYQFWKEKMAELKSKAESSDPSKTEELQKQLEEYKAKLESGEANKHFKDLYESTKKEAEQYRQKYEETVQTFEQKQREQKIVSELNEALSGLEFDPNIKKPVLDTYLNTVKSELLKNAQVQEDGSVTYYDSEGNLIQNKKTFGKASAKEIMQMRLKDVIAEQRNQGGGGSGGNGNGARKPNTGSLSSAKNKMELTDMIEETLLADGIKKGTEDFLKKSTELFQEYGKDLPLR